MIGRLPECFSERATREKRRAGGSNIFSVLSVCLVASPAAIRNISRNMKAHVCCRISPLRHTFHFLRLYLFIYYHYFFFPLRPQSSNKPCLITASSGPRPPNVQRRCFKIKAEEDGGEEMPHTHHLEKKKKLSPPSRCDLFLCKCFWCESVAGGESALWSRSHVQPPGEQKKNQ